MYSSHIKVEKKIVYNRNNFFNDPNFRRLLAFVHDKAFMFPSEVDKTGFSIIFEGDAKNIGVKWELQNAIQNKAITKVWLHDGRIEPNSRYVKELEDYLLKLGIALKSSKKNNSRYEGLFITFPLMDIKSNTAVEPATIIMNNIEKGTKNTIDDVRKIVIVNFIKSNFLSLSTVSAEQSKILSFLPLPKDWTTEQSKYFLDFSVYALYRLCLGDVLPFVLIEGAKQIPEVSSVYNTIREIALKKSTSILENINTFSRINKVEDNFFEVLVSSLSKVKQLINNPQTLCDTADFINESTTGHTDIDEIINKQKQIISENTLHSTRVLHFIKDNENIAFRSLALSILSLCSNLLREQFGRCCEHLTLSFRTVRDYSRCNWQENKDILKYVKQSANGKKVDLSSLFERVRVSLLAKPLQRDRNKTRKPAIQKSPVAPNSKAAEVEESATTRPARIPTEIKFIGQIEDTYETALEEPGTTLSEFTMPNVRLAETVHWHVKGLNSLLSGDVGQSTYDFNRVQQPEKNRVIYSWKKDPSNQLQDLLSVISNSDSKTLFNALNTYANNKKISLSLGMSSADTSIVAAFFILDEEKKIYVTYDSKNITYEDSSSNGDKTIVLGLGDRLEDWFLHDRVSDNHQKWGGLGELIKNVNSDQLQAAVNQYYLCALHTLRNNKGVIHKLEEKKIEPLLEFINSTISSVDEAKKHLLQKKESLTIYDLLNSDHYLEIVKTLRSNLVSKYGIFVRNCSGVLWDDSCGMALGALPEFEPKIC